MLWYADIESSVLCLNGLLTQHRNVCFEAITVHTLMCVVLFDSCSKNNDGIDFTMVLLNTHMLSVLHPLQSMCLEINWQENIVKSNIMNSIWHKRHARDTFPLGQSFMHHDNSNQWHDLTKLLYTRTQILLTTTPKCNKVSWWKRLKSVLFVWKSAEGNRHHTA